MSHTPTRFLILFIEWWLGISYLKKKKKRWWYISAGWRSLYYCSVFDAHAPGRPSERYSFVPYHPNRTASALENESRRNYTFTISTKKWGWSKQQLPENPDAQLILEFVKVSHAVTYDQTVTLSVASAENAPLPARGGGWLIFAFQRLQPDTTPSCWQR